MVLTRWNSALALLFVASTHSIPTPEGQTSPSIIPITGPVIDSNFPDPCFIEENGVYYAFATATVNELPRIHVATSNDFLHWQEKQGYDGLAHLPPWANTTLYRNTWAPDVVKQADGTFVMLFSALINNSSEQGNHCIGVGRAKTPIGPYVPDSTPLICPGSFGVIDSALFTDSDGQRYVVFKQEISSTPLVARKVDADVRTLMSGPVTLLTNRGASDDYIIEAPQIIRAASDPETYVLFFSSGYFANSSYTISYATSKNVLGPYTRQAPAVTSQSSGIRGPGGMQLNPAGDKMVFHGLIDHKEPIPDRGMWVAGVSIKNGVVKVG